VGRALLLRALLVLASLSWASLAAAAEHAGKVYLTLEEALELVFGEAEIERGTVYLTDEQRKQAEELAGEELAGAIVHPYTARIDGKVVGTAWVDAHRVRTLRETVLIVVAPDQRVRRVELLAFGEPEDYVPRSSWYGQFTGRRLDKDLRLGRGIRGVTGATLTARATTSAVRRVLAVQRVLEGPPPEDGLDPERVGPQGRRP
jgi:hypothetical protein